MIPANNRKSSKIYICYYSQHCEYSKELINEIFKFKAENKIELLCVDNAHIKKKLPKYITDVPTIVNIKNKNLYVGDKNCKEIVFKIIKGNPVLAFNTGICGTFSKKYTSLNKNDNSNINSYNYSSINDKDDFIHISNNGKISDSIDRDDLSKKLQELEKERENDIKIKRNL